MLRVAVLALPALCAIPATGQATGRDGAEPQSQDWQSLRVPSLCVEPLTGARLPRLLTGTHLWLPDDEPEAAGAPPAPAHLPLAALVGLIQEETRRKSWTVSLHPSTPPLLARGAKASVDELAALLDELDRAGRALDIDLTAWITPGAAAVGTHVTREVLDKSVAGASPWASSRSRSGDQVVLGERRSKAFVATYSVEVATDSGVAAPVVGQLLTGRTLHVRACRVRGGTRVHVEGFLDFAEDRGMRVLDTGSPDLGLVQEPRVACVQIGFSGVVDSGGALVVSVTGSPLEGKDFTLWLSASTAPDPKGTAWRALDLALLETRQMDLPLVSPGAGLAALAPEDALPALAEALPSSAVAQAAEGARSGSSLPGRGRPLVAWSPGLLLAPASDDAAWREMDTLVAAGESARLAEVDVAIEAGPLRASVPSCVSMPLRVLIGEETSILCDYDVQIAPETWMPGPHVERALDGLVLQGSAFGAGVRLFAWEARAAEPEELSRQELQLGRLQLTRRTFRSSRGYVLAGAPARELLAHSGDASGVRVEVRSR